MPRLLHSARTAYAAAVASLPPTETKHWPSRRTGDALPLLKALGSVHSTRVDGPCRQGQQVHRYLFTTRELGMRVPEYNIPSQKYRDTGILWSHQL